jgi:hypothetical protein
LSIIPASCSEPSITCYFGISSLSPSPPAVSGVISSIEPRASHEVIHRFNHRFHPLRYFCILQYRRLSPTSPKKGDSLSDPSSFGLQSSTHPYPRSIETSSYSRIIYRSILSLANKSSKTGESPPIRSMHSPLIPKSLAEAFRPNRLSSTSALTDARYSSSGFNSRIPVLSNLNFFFQASSLDLSRHATSNHANRITQIEAFVPILALLWNPGKNWLVQRRDAVAKKGDRGVLGKEGMQSQT